jgi:hypothetical protein
MVLASGTPAKPVVVDRRRFEMLDGSLPRQPYHAVAEEGADPTVIRAVEHAAGKGALHALQSCGDVAAVGLVASERRLPDALDRILASHALLHAAEGHLYERAWIDAANELGIRVHVTRPESIAVSSAVETLGRQLGPPWQKDHKWATTAALAALGGHVDTAGRSRSSISHNC